MPSSLPPPSEEDLEFEDPPDSIKDDMMKAFWCISSKVRDKVMENRDKKIFFCYHNGFCTFQSDYNESVAMVRN